MNNSLFLPEWTHVEAVIVALPHSDTDWSYMLDDVREQYRLLVEALAQSGVQVIVLVQSRQDAEELLNPLGLDNIIFIETDFNDTWTRDYGPIAVVDDGRNTLVDFGFNGWGLKFASDKDNLVNLNLRDKFIILPENYRNRRSFILEGGSIETDGEGTLLTTSRCLLSPNRNGGMNKKEICNFLTDALGTDHILWLDYGYLAGDDTDSHIDTLARLAPDDTIIFVGCRNVDDEHFEELLKMRAQLTLFRTPAGEPYNLIELPLPDPIFDEDGNRLPATYANYLVLNDFVFMPTYNQPQNDSLACKMIQIAYPDAKVIAVDCRQLIRQHGSLHCATMQIPAGFLNDTVLLSNQSL